MMVTGVQRVPSGMSLDASVGGSAAADVLCRLAHYDSNTNLGRALYLPVPCCLMSVAPSPVFVLLYQGAEPC